MSLTLIQTGPLARTSLALAERLKLVFPPARFEHAFMPAKITPAEWKSLTRRTPFVGLGWTEIAPRREASRLFDGESHWTVYLVAKNAAGLAARYHGDRQGPGLFQMVQAAVAVLHGWTVEEIGTAFVDRAGNLFAEGWDADDVAIAGIDVSVGLTMPIAEALGGTEPDALTALGIVWNFEATGEYPDVIIKEAAA